MKKYKVYLIDDMPTGYIGKLEELHEKNKYTEIELEVPTLIRKGKLSLEEIFEEIFEQIKKDKNASAIMVDNLFRLGGGNVWLYEVIKKNDKIKESIKEIISNKVKIFIFTNQTDKDADKLLIEAIKNVAENAGIKNFELYQILKVSPDTETWINNVYEHLKKGEEYV